MSAPGGTRGGWADRIARWTIPSLENWCMLLVLYVLVEHGWRLLLDSDTGWHIRAGDWILRHRSVPREDLFSYTMAGHPWYAWEWLSDALMSWLHAARGLPGIAGAAIVLLTASYAMLFRVMVRRGADAFTAFALTLFGLFASMIHLLARPHLISIPLMLLWCAVVEHHRRTGSRWIWALPVVILIWTNLHGGFVITFPMLLVYALGEWLERGLAGEAWSPATRRRLGTYALVGVLSLLASAVNPYGVHLYRHLWDFLHQKELLAGNLEFRSPDFHRADGMLMEVLLIMAVFAAARAASRRRWVEAGLVLLWTHLTLQSLRHVTLAAVVLLPIIAEQLSQAVAELTGWLSRRGGGTGARWGALRAWAGRMLRTDRMTNGAVVHLLALGFLVYAVAGGSADRWLPAGFSPKEFPVAAVDFVARERAQGRLRGHLFAHDQYGGYLIYRLYPDVRVFVDGRGDMYAHGPVLKDMLAVATVEPGWSEVLDRHEVEWILTPTDRPLSLIARASGRWTTAYADSTAQVLIRAAAQR